ncbi:MAG TPA: YihY/virulence factor BrkB family protein [Candidatus Acidoferrales bacterium]|nr:YihY/virulence factor BrkB family protein [Candidatus Acidoferrales bacterium]
MSARLLLFSERHSGVFRRIWDQIEEDDCIDLAAQISYFFALSLFPFCLVLAVIVGWLPSTTAWHSFAIWIVTYLPRESQHLVFSTILGLSHHSAGFLSFGLIAALWSSSSGFVSLMESLSVVYLGRDSRSFFRKHAIASGVAVLTMAFAMATFWLMALGHWSFGRFVGLVGAWRGSDLMLAIGRWGATAVVMGLAIDLAYYYLPDGKRPWHWITWGTTFAVLALAGSTAAFNLYVRHFSSYPRIYGALGGFILLMIWIYVICFILLVGAETDHVLEAPANEARAG